MVQKIWGSGAENSGKWCRKFGEVVQKIWGSGVRVRVRVRVRRPAEGGTSGRDKRFPYHLYIPPLIQQSSAKFSNVLQSFSKISAKFEEKVRKS